MVANAPRGENYKEQTVIIGFNWDATRETFEQFLEHERGEAEYYESRLSDRCVEVVPEAVETESDTDIVHVRGWMPRTSRNIGRMSDFIRRASYGRINFSVDNEAMTRSMIEDINRGVSMLRRNVGNYDPLRGEVRVPVPDGLSPNSVVVEERPNAEMCYDANPSRSRCFVGRSNPATGAFYGVPIGEIVATPPRLVPAVDTTSGEESGAPRGRMDDAIVGISEETAQELIRVSEWAREENERNVASMRRIMGEDA